MTRSDPLLARLGLTPRQMYNQSQQEGRVGTWLYACDNGDFWWSDQVYRIYGLPKNTGLRSALFLSQVHEDDVALAREMFSRAMGGKAYHFVHRIRVGSEVKWLEQRGRLHRGKDCPVPYVVGMVRDVTTQKRMEARLEGQRADFSAITGYLAETTDTTDLAAIVASVKRTIRRRMDVAIIAVFARQGDQITRVMPKGMDRAETFLFQDIRDFVGYRAATEGQRHLCSVADYPNPLGREALEDLGGQSIVSLPIRHGHSTIGALSIVTKHPGDLTGTEEAFCRTICGHLSNQLNSALLYARLKQELALRVRLESDREVIFNESVDFISIIHRDGRFGQINPAFAARLGHLPEELIGQSVFDFICPDDRAYARRVFHDLPKAGVVRGFRNRFLFAGDELGYMESNLKYMPVTDSVVAIARDLTDQREMEARNTDLEHSVAIEKMKSEFFAGLSHEFKTPLNIILSTLDLVRMKSTQEDEARFQGEYAKFFDYAYQNCYRLLRLTSNLLDASRIESRYYHLHPAPVQLDALLASAVGTAEVYALARGVTLSFRAACGPAPLVCDEDGVERILLNLLSNAIKNTRAGGGVEVVLTACEHAYHVSVADSGVGILPEALPTIFEKFKTDRNPLSGRREGSGIGLSLVKSLVEMHGGQVTVQSQVGVGSTFTFTLSKHLTPAEPAFRLEPDHASHARMELSDLD